MKVTGQQYLELNPDLLAAGVMTRLDKLIADMTEVKADVKAIKAKG